MELGTLPMFRVRVASAEICIAEPNAPEWVFYEAVSEGAKGGLR